MTDVIDLEQFYTAKQAAEVLSRNSGRVISPAYVRNLAKYRAIGSKPLSNRLTLYPKVDVDAYRVEDRGVKGGRASHERAEKKLEEEEE